MNNSTQQRLNAQLRVDPRVVLSGQLLELNSIELRSSVESELMENPALEWLDEGLSNLTEADILQSVNPRELSFGSDDREFQRSRPQDATETDWLDFVAAFDSLEDHLEAQLFHRLAPEDVPIAECMIASLDDRGYLSCSLEELALDHQLDYARCEVVLKKLHTCEPSGIGARDLQECLSLQLKNADTTEGQLAYEIVTHAFEALVQRNVRALSRKFRAVPELIQAAFDEIMQLTPFPADAFSRDQRQVAKSRSASVPVDLVIQRTEQGWSVELPGIKSEDLVVNRAYREQLAAFEKRSLQDDAYRHLSTYVNRAKLFIEAMAQRGSTLRRIGHYLIDNQPGFVSTGDYAFLKSLTRRKLSQDLNLHESTISRATAGKHVQLANGEVVSFDVFFKPALRIQQMIAEILADETHQEPLSDERIALMLAERGVHVARRTVNKYRDRTKTLSSRRRQSA